MSTNPARFDALQIFDIERLVELNNAAAPAVPIVSADEMAALLETAGFTLAARQNDRLIGFVIGMRPGSDYASENYRFFSQRSADFLYIDRIVIDSQHRGAGTGRALYEAVFDLAKKERAAQVNCEVNILPPNPESLAFHARLGFDCIGEQATKNGSVVVALLAAVI